MVSPRKMLIEMLLAYLCRGGSVEDFGNALYNLHNATQESELSTKEWRLIGDLIMACDLHGPEPHSNRMFKRVKYWFTERRYTQEDVIRSAKRLLKSLIDNI